MTLKLANVTDQPTSLMLRPFSIVTLSSACVCIVADIALGKINGCRHLHDVQGQLGAPPASFVCFLARF